MNRNKRGFKQKNTSLKERKHKSEANYVPEHLASIEPNLYRAILLGRLNALDMTKKGFTNRIVDFEKFKSKWNSAIQKQLKTVKKTVCTICQLDFTPANSDFAMVNAQSIDRLKCLLFKTLRFTLYANDQCKICLTGFRIQNQSPLPQQKLHQFRPF